MNHIMEFYQEVVKRGQEDVSLIEMMNGQADGNNWIGMSTRIKDNTQPE